MSKENYDEILRDVDEIMSMSGEVTNSEPPYYAGSKIDEKVLLKQLVTSGCEWMNSQRSVYSSSLVGKSNEKKLRKECRKYIIETNKPSGFIPTFVWAWIVKALIEWVVSKILERMLLKEESQITASLKMLKNMEVLPAFKDSQIFIE